MLDEQLNYSMDQIEQPAGMDRLVTLARLWSPNCCLLLMRPRTRCHTGPVDSHCAKWHCPALMDTTTLANLDPSRPTVTTVTRRALVQTLVASFGTQIVAFHACAHGYCATLVFALGLRPDSVRRYGLRRS